MKFRKKPVEVEAYQITRSLLAGALFDGQSYPTGLKCVRSSCHPPSRFISEWVGEVVTIHGQATKVIEGDWIITEPDGVHFYPCKPDIFEKTYESPVEEPLVKGEEKIPSNKDLKGKWVILKDISCSDFMKDKNGRMKIYDSLDDACLVCGMYEFENAIVVKIEYNHIEP